MCPSDPPLIKPVLYRLFPDNVISIPESPPERSAVAIEPEARAHVACCSATLIPSACSTYWNSQSVATCHPAGQTHWSEPAGALAGAGLLVAASN